MLFDKKLLTAKPTDPLRCKDTAILVILYYLVNNLAFYYEIVDSLFWELGIGG